MKIKYVNLRVTNNAKLANSTQLNSGLLKAVAGRLRDTSE